MLIYINSLIFILVGYLIGYLICKILKLETFLVILLNNKRYSIKLHHLYFLFISLIAAVVNMNYLAFTSLGIGLHDLIIEVRKKLNNSTESKNS